ncbi:MAG: hypothetical protein PUD92_03420 [Clostridiales bacterium]|nr:hypothetical protein [Clostridiales bacterium]
MKKIISAVVFAACITIPYCALAANGDIAGEIYTTDILTQVDGKDIASYSIDGETMIALEDLEQYGFNIKYDDSVRTVFINQTGECPADFEPHIQRGTPGGRAGYYYESDIRAYVNGQPIEAYALDGKMAAKVETLGNVTEDSEYGVSCYLMTYSYDDSKRLLSLYTGKSKLPPTEQIKTDFENKDDYFWSYGGEIPIDGGTILIGGQHGTPHGSYAYYYYLGNDKLFMKLDYALTGAYNLRDGWGHTEISDVKADGECISFKGIKFSGMVGEYRFNPRTFEMEVVEENYHPDIDFEESFREQMVFGKNIYTSDVKTVIDGIPVNTYRAEGLDRIFIETDIFEHLGYTVTEASSGKLYLKRGEGDAGWRQALRSPGELIGTVDRSDIVSINGYTYRVYYAGDKALIDADRLWAVEYGKDLPEYEMYNVYGADPCGISGRYDAQTNTLTLNTNGLKADFEELKEKAKHLYDGREGTQPHIAADNESYFVIEYNIEGYGMECYLITKDSRVINIGKVMDFLNVFSRKAVSVENDILTISCGDGSDVRLDINEMKLLQ